jgi:hypothetical protein
MVTCRVEDKAGNHGSEERNVVADDTRQGGKSEGNLTRISTVALEANA